MKIKMLTVAILLHIIWMIKTGREGEVVARFFIIWFTVALVRRFMSCLQGINISGQIIVVFLQVCTIICQSACSKVILVCIYDIAEVFIKYVAYKNIRNYSKWEEESTWIDIRWAKIDQNMVSVASLVNSTQYSK